LSVTHRDCSSRNSLDEAGVDLTQARLDVRGKCVIQIGEFGVWQTAERFQRGAASRRPDLAEHQGSRLGG
jgi:hypothetical protein